MKALLLAKIVIDLASLVGAAGIAFAIWRAGR